MKRGSGVLGGTGDQEGELEKSGRWDLNPRPLGPEPSALARLRHAPCLNDVA